MQTDKTAVTGACNAKRADWYDVFERLKNQIAWLEYVPEHELTSIETSRLCKASESLIVVISKLNRKYVD